MCTKSFQLLAAWLWHAEVDSMLQKIGVEIARLHDGGLVHGDLTTSNMIMRSTDKQVVSDEAQWLASALS